jgi:hypothetical protein
VSDIQLASDKRIESILFDEIDRRIDLLLSNYQKVTSNPRSMGYLRFLLRHYAGKAHPWRECFTADTPVDAPRDMDKYPDGIPISQIKKDDLVWSFNTNLQVFELKTVKWSEQIRKSAQLVMVILDSGKMIRCTPDHRFMCRDSTYVEAQDLHSGDSLMPFYRDYLPLVRLSPDRSQWASEYKCLASVSSKSKNNHIHHLDERRSNNDPNNFSLLDNADHLKIHHETARDKINQKQDLRKCRYCTNIFLPQYKNHLTCGECPESASYMKQIIGKELRCTNCDNPFVATGTTQIYCSAKCRQESYSDERKKVNCKNCGKLVRTRKVDIDVTCRSCTKKLNEKIKDKIIVRSCKNCGDEFTVQYRNHVHCTKKCRDLYSKRAYRERNPAVGITYNHKVLSVVVLDEYEDVWDIEVEDNHNFVVNGVVVHNCYKDNLKRFGPKTKGLCGVLKDTIRQTTFWRGKAGHSKTPDVGDPGYVIGEADKGAAPPWGGHRHLSELDMGEMAMPEDVALILEDLSERCDVYRVLIGLDEPPQSEMVLL